MANSGFGGADFGRHWARHVDAVWSQHRGGPGGGHGGHGRGGPPGPPPWIAGLFGLGQGEQQRGPRVRRGDVRSAIIDVVREAGERGEPVNGYQVIQQIAERSGQEWRPSPGSVYPTIQQLEDEGLLTSEDERGRKSLKLTEAGLAYVVEHANELAAVWAPFERQTGRGEMPWSDIKPEIGQVMSAMWQIITNGSDSQRAAAVDVLVETRRKLYGILADGDDAPTDDPDDPDQLDQLDDIDEMDGPGDRGDAGESGSSRGGAW